MLPGSTCHHQLKSAASYAEVLSERLDIRIGETTRYGYIEVGFKVCDVR